MATIQKSHSRKSPANRNAYISSAFLQYLCDRVPGFSVLNVSDQLHLTNMITQATTRYREHSHYPGCAFFSMHELESRFGRSKFKHINDRLNIFAVESEWSKIEGRTKPFRLNENIANLRTEFFCLQSAQATNLLAQDGDVRSVIPKNALMGRRRTESSIESTRKGWRGKTVTSAVPINEKQLLKLAEGIQLEIDSRAQDNRSLGAIDKDNAAYVLTDIQLILHHAKNTVAPGCVIHRYQESISGRLYAQDVNLQNTHRQVRMAALHGLWDYDIENCHYSILHQMSARVGFESKAIAYYLQNKSRIRGDLAHTIGVSELQIKKALLAMVYGASLSTKPDAAIPETLGAIDVAVAFYEHPIIQQLATEIRSSTEIILTGTKRKRGRIANMRNLEMAVKGKKPRHLLAHLLQGVEATALEAAHDVYSDEIVLLQHDGFTATSPHLNIETIQNAIFAATGYNLKLSRSEPLIGNARAAFINWG